MTPKELPMSRKAALQWCEGEYENAVLDLDSAIKKPLRRMGEVLTRIRDEQLYLETHKSFETYLRGRWNLSKARGYQLIEHTATVKNLLMSSSKSSKKSKNDCAASTIVDTKRTSGSEIEPSEAVTRELAGLEPDEQMEVYAEASEGNGKPPTAAAVKSVVKKRKNAAGGAYKPPKKADKTEDQKHIEAADRCYVEMANHIYAYCRLASVNRAPFDKGLAKMHGLIQGAKR